MIYAYRGEESVEEYVVHFVDGPFCEIKGEGDEEYIVSFTDLTTGEISYRNKIKPNHWVRPNKKYFTKWLVEVFRVFDRERVLKHEFDPSGRRIAIWLGSKSLGDTLAWMPYLEEFRKKHDCEVFTATWWNELLAPVYPEITFMKVGESVPDLYASYTMGVYDGDTDKHREDWRSVPLQKVASDILGISYKEVRSKIADLGGSVDVDGDGDYICIAEFSTARCKLWNRLNGWQDVVDRLTEAGERVVSISKEPTGLGSNVLRLNDRKMKDTIATLKNAKLFIGVSSGLAWVAWALGVPVVLISGFTEEFNEFTSGVARVMDKSVCHGCFNDKEYSFDRGNWNWCPRDKDFECTRVITPEMVMLAIESLKKE
jgi:autotransporter strand-loop-strand O-heptosyltransferase